MNLIFVVLAHADRESLWELVMNVRAFCPGADLMLYNSGTQPDLASGLGMKEFPGPHYYDYAHITPFFFDLFEWAYGSEISFDAIVNLETDLLFIRPGYEAFVESQLLMADYVAPNLFRRRPLKSYWRPMRSLRPEFDRWLEFFGFRYLHGAFSPAQIFSRPYVKALLEHPGYRRLRTLVSENHSFTLQEILFPTLTDFLGLRLRGYPAAHATTNRYRPYQAISGVKRALAIPDAFFVHPVRRTLDDPTRTFIRRLAAEERVRSKSAV